MLDEGSAKAGERLWLSGAYYTPRAFYIWLDEGIFDPGTKRLLRPGAFAHEFAHLLQDLSTVYGIVDFINLLDLISDARRVLMAAPLSAPLSQTLQAQGLWFQTSKKIRKIAYPETEWQRGAKSAWMCVSDYSKDVDFDGFHFPQVSARFVNDGANDTFEHELGAIEVKEAYSTAVQALYGDPLADDESVRLEYLAVELLLRRYLGTPTPEHIIAICHWALQHVLPAQRLVQLAKMLNAKGPLPSAEETYDLCRDFARADGFESLVWLCNKQLKEQLRHRYKTTGSREDPLYRALCWYRHSAIPLLRQSLNGRFPLGTALCVPKADADASFIAMMQLYSVPVLEDETGIYTCYSDALPSDSVFLFRGIGHLLRSIDNAKAFRWRCPFCVRCNLKTRDDKCLSTPWVKAGEKPVCPYGLASKYLDVRVLSTRG